MMTVKTLYDEMIKGVFKTYVFPYDKWKDSIPPENIYVSRNCFYDNKNKEPLFSQNICEKLEMLYESALNNELKSPSASQVSIRINNILIKFFNIDYKEMLFAAKEPSEEKDKKFSFWLGIVNRLSNHALNKSREDEIDTALFKTSLPSEDTDPKLKKIYIDDDRNYLIKAEPIGKDLKCLFFLRPVFIPDKDFNLFLKKYEDRSLLKAKELPSMEINITGRGDSFSELKRELISGRIIFLEKLNDADENLEIYAQSRFCNMEKVVKDKNHSFYYTKGSFDGFLDVKRAIPQTTLVVLFPEDYVNACDNLMIKRYNDNDLDKKIKEYKKSIDSVLANEITVKPVFFPFMDKVDENMYLAGFFDSILDPQAATESFFGVFKKMYGSLSHFMESKNHGYPSFPHPIITVDD